MREMRGARMATLAVHALLLSVGARTCRTAVAAAAAAAPTLVSAGGAGHDNVFAALRSAVGSRPFYHSSPTSAATASHGHPSRRHRDETDGKGVGESKQMFSQGLRRRSQREGRQESSLGSSRAEKIMHSPQADSERPAPLNMQRLWRQLAGVREAQAAGAGGWEGGGRRLMEGGASQEQRRVRGVGWVKRISRTGTSTSTSSETADGEDPQELRGSVYTRTAAMIDSMVKAPSETGRTAPGTGTSAATSKAAEAGASLSPGRSYLEWTSKEDVAMGPVESSGYDQVGKRKRNKNSLLSSGVGNREAGAGAGGDSSSTPTAGKGEDEEEGSLGAAKSSRGGGGAGAVSLSFKEAMFAGAISRSIAQTCMQPANVVKTLLQGRGTASQLSNLSFKLLTRGAGAQFVMSLPHGAFNYATLEVILGCSAKIFPDEWRERAGPVLDFFSSSVATMVCSVVSTPQMVLTDRIMAGMYPNLVSGVREITRTQGLSGFYTGWSANVAQKIPSYGLTWVFFQQFKRIHRKATDRPPTNTENFVLGAAAAGATVCIMIPMDTVKTRLVTQTAQAGVVPYKGVLRTLSRIIKEEGLGPIYRSLTPRLVSVVPMIGIQFGIYEFVRKEIMSRKDQEKPRDWLPPVIRRTLRLDAGNGSLQPQYFKDFVQNVYLLEEELL
ncbi:unnamed protein product [Scytosiphon promiscuus]